MIKSGLLPVKLILLAAAALAAALAEGCSASAGSVVATAGAGPAQLGPSRLAPFELADQEGRIHRYEGCSAGPAVLLVGKPDAAATNTAWDKWLAERYGDAVTVFRIVDVSSVPRLFEPIVVSRIRAGADPPGVPVLLDWEGRFFAAHHLAAESTNVLLIEPDGTICRVVHGPPDPERQGEVAGGIELLRRRHHAE